MLLLALAALGTLPALSGCTPTPGGGTTWTPTGIADGCYHSAQEGTPDIAVLDQAVEANTYMAAQTGSTDGNCEGIYEGTGPWLVEAPDFNVARAMCAAADPDNQWAYSAASWGYSTLPADTWICRTN
jgi:hypothetical protein